MISPTDYTGFLLSFQKGGEDESIGHCGPAAGAGKRNKEVLRDEDAKCHPKQLRQLAKVYERKVLDFWFATIRNQRRIFPN